MEMPANEKEAGAAKEGAEEGLTGSASPAAHQGKVLSGGEILGNITSLVRGSAVAIAEKLLEAAKAGQVAHVRYLFEMAGIYPTVDEGARRGEGESLSCRLMKELGLPTEPGGVGKNGAGTGAGRDTVK